MDVPVFIGSKKNSYPVTPHQAKIYGANAVDSIIVNAKFIKNQLINTGRVNQDKIEIIYNGVDLDAFHPEVGSGNVRESFRIESGCPLFGMIANFAKKKSHEIFFGAALKVLKEMPDVKFLLVGGGDYMIYQTRITDTGFGKSFIFTGFRKDIPEIISSIDFSVISSSKGEGLTGSLVESMVMAKPVISTDVAGNPEFVKHMETGLLVPAGNVDKMADAMLYFLRNREAAEKMGKNAYALARDKFDNKKHAKCFENLYYKIITRKKNN
jgi:glycosyltransferase involved in cell wall biosynthesis